MKHIHLQSILLIVLFLCLFLAIVPMGFRQGKINGCIGDGAVSLRNKPTQEELIAKGQEPLPGLTENDPVYVTKTGEKFHLYSDCSYLKNASEIRGILCKDALEAGKELCSRCESRREKAAG